MDLSAVKIQGDRLQKNLLELARYGTSAGGGLMRMALSDADLETRLWFQERMREAGLRVHEDATLGAQILAETMMRIAYLCKEKCARRRGLQRKRSQGTKQPPIIWGMKG